MTERPLSHDEENLIQTCFWAINLGGLDNWASALPVTPPIALPISAGTVAQTVALEVPGRISYIVEGEIPIY